MSRSLYIAACLAILLAANSFASAENRDWVGTVDNSWFNADNWAPSGAPAPSDDLQVLGGTATASRVDVEDGSVAIGRDSSVSFNQLWVGLYGQAELSVSHSDLYTGLAVLGRNAGSNATAYIYTDTGRWTIGGELYLGWSGTATLNVITGAETTAGFVTLGFQPGGYGSAVIDGSNSRLSASGLAVGQLGRGDLTVRNGGLVSDAYGLVGNGAGSQGTVLVDNATWNNDSFLYVGGTGTAEMTVQQGGLVTSDVSVIGHSLGGRGTANVTGPGSRWETTGALYVGGADTGYVGQGELHISDGGVVTSSTGIIGSTTGSVGTVNISGADSRWEHGDELVVGDSGQGTLNLTDGTQLTSYNAVLGRDAGSSGTAVVDGGSDWQLNALLSAGNGPVPLIVGDHGAASLQIIDGSVSANYTAVGAKAGGDGQIVMDGPAADFDPGLVLLIGGSQTSTAGGHGSMTVHNGAQLATRSGAIVSLGFSNGATGELLMEGQDSTMSSARLYVGGGKATPLTGSATGGSGTGNLTVREAGVVTTNEFAVIGHSFNSAGVATVTGPGSRWDIAGDLNIGGADAESVGRGELNISNGGKVTSATGILGRSTGSIGTVNIDGASSQWDHGDDLVIGAAGQGTVNLTDGANLANRHAILGRDVGSIGTVTVDGGSSFGAASGAPSVDNPPSLIVGDQGTGRIEVRNGTLSSSYVALGNQPGGDGQIILDGPDATWLCQNDGTVYMLIGGSQFSPVGGKGSVTVRNGAQISTSLFTNVSVGFSAASTGELVVDGEGSSVQASRFYVGGGVGQSGTGLPTAGGAGSGTIIVRDGGQLNTIPSTSVYLGYASGSTGTLIVDGANSSLTGPGSVQVGVAGQGFMTVSGGAGSGETTPAFQVLGVSSGSAGVLTVTDPGSRVQVPTSSYASDAYGSYRPIGNKGRAEVYVQNGGILDTSMSSAAMRLAHASYSQAVMTVEDAGSQWLAQTAVIGHGGQAEVNVRNGGLVDASTMQVAMLPGSSGVVNVTNGGSVTASYTEIALQPGASGTVNISDTESRWDSDEMKIGGTVNVDDGGTLEISQLLSVEPGGQLALNGGSVQVGPNATDWVGNQVYVNGGTLALGGQVTGNVLNSDIIDLIGDNAMIDGDYTQDAASHLVVELGGTQPGESDFLNITGTADLAGMLTIFLSPSSYEPQLGDVFHILTAGFIDGSFDELVVPDSDLMFSVIQTNTTLSLEVVDYVWMQTRAYGDFTGDGIVDTSDYTVWADSFGMTGPRLPADATGDGVVSTNDYTVWADGFGKPVPLPANVPEPGVVLLLTAGVIATLTKRRRD